MTIAEMHIALKLELDKTTALELPAFEPEEFDLWLNLAIKKFVKTRYSGVNIKGKSFEQTQKRIDDLRTLVEHAIIDSDDLDPSTTYAPNSFVADLSSISGSTYWFALEEATTIDIDGTTSKVGVVESTIDEVRRMLENPFSEHILHYGSAKPIRIFDGDSVELITDGNYDVTEYHLTFLKQPVEVETDDVSPVNCDLPEHTHDEIVRMAANMILENIEQPRYQTHAREIATME